MTAAYLELYDEYWACLRAPELCDPVQLTASIGPARAALTKTVTDLVTGGLYVGDDDQGYVVVESVAIVDPATAVVSRSWKPGPMPLTAKRDLYVQLMNQGMSNSEACRQVGVNRKAGQRWRHGRVVKDTNGVEYSYAPIVPAANEVSTRYLSDQERFVIADGVRAGRSKRSIAAELGRSVSTVCRELARNSEPSGEYRPHAAQQRMLARRPRPKHRRVVLNAELRGMVQERLNKRWSPEQISKSLRVERPDRPDLHLAPESIYQALYAVSSVLTCNPKVVLRTGRQNRKRQRSGKRTSRFIVPMTPAGQAASESLTAAIATAGYGSRDLPLPAGTDLNSVVRQERDWIGRQLDRPVDARSIQRDLARSGRLKEQPITSTAPISHRCEHDRERDWLLLERFAELSSQSAVELDADDFMWMGAAEFADGRVVHSYKHIDSRPYLHLDAGGHSYRYIASADGGCYVQWPDPREAIGHALDPGVSR